MNAAAQCFWPKSKFLGPVKIISRASNEVCWPHLIPRKANFLIHLIFCWRMLPQWACQSTQKPVWALAVEKTVLLTFYHCNVLHCQQRHKNCTKYILALPHNTCNTFHFLLPQHHLSPAHSHRILQQTVYWKAMHPPAGILFQTDRAGIALAGVFSGCQTSVGEPDSLLGSLGALKVLLNCKG